MGHPVVQRWRYSVAVGRPRKVLRMGWVKGGKQFRAAVRLCRRMAGGTPCCSVQVQYRGCGIPIVPAFFDRYGVTHVEIQPTRRLEVARVVTVKGARALASRGWVISRINVTDLTFLQVG